MRASDEARRQGVGRTVLVACLVTGLIAHFAFPRSMPRWGMAIVGLVLYAPIDVAHPVRGS